MCNTTTFAVTDIALNSRKMLGTDRDPAAEMADTRRRMAAMGVPVDKLSDEQIEGMIEQRMTDFRERAPLSAAGAATDKRAACVAGLSRKSQPMAKQTLVHINS